MATSLEHQPDRPDRHRDGIETRATAAIAEELAGRGLHPAQAGSQPRVTGEVRSPGADPLS
jgi:hypothetical protein